MIVVLAAAFALLGLPAVSAPEVSVVPASGGARLLVGGKLITAFRAANGSLSAAERAETAAARLRSLIAEGLSPGEITVRARTDGSWAVYAGGGVLMIATADEARLRKQQPEAVARVWAANLKTSLGSAAAVNTTAAKFAGKATVGARITDLSVPVGEGRLVPVKGTATGPLTVRVAGSVATAVVTGDGNAIEVRGVSPGKATVRMSRGAKHSAFTVWVKKWAGSVEGTPVAMVTGTVTPGSYVKKVAVERALEGVRREPGATVKITGPVEGIKALGRGDSLTARFPITISGPGLLERKTYATVRVDNLELQREPANLLLYSNDPESVREYGTLYEGLLEDTGPGRLMFHHQNRMGQPFWFEVHLLNPNRTPVDVQIIEGEAGPVLDTIQVGHRAAQRYMEAAADDVGYVITIPPRKGRTIYRAKVPQILTVSGLYGLRILDGGPLIAHVSSSPQPDLPEVTDDLLQAARSEPDTYPSPQKTESYQYRVGERWCFIPLGRKAISAKTPNKKLFGNYGVVYNLTVDLTNPTDEEKTVTVRLAAEAGWTRGVFAFDGKIVEAPQIAPPSDAVLWSVKLAPQEHRQVRIQGIPVGGSAYPVSLVVRS